MFKVICVGSATLDNFLTIHQKLKSVTYGSKVLVKHLETHTGGGGSNAAVALAKLGLKVGYLGKLGDDRAGEIIIREFRENKIKIFNENRSSLPTDEAFILNSEQEKDRVIYVHKGSSEDLRVRELPRRLAAKWFYLATLVKGSFSVLPYLAGYARKNKIKVLFNPSTYLARQGLKKLGLILKNTNILILNKEEAKLLLKTKSNSISFLLKKLRGVGVGLVVVTNGAKPVYAFDGKVVYSAQPPKVKVVHTAGCGDAFNAGFLAGIIKTEDIPFAIKLGLANSASVVQHLGTKNKLLTARQTKRLINQENIQVIKHEIRSK